MEKHDTDAQPDLEPFHSNVAHDLTDVMLDPVVFHHAAKQLKFKPLVTCLPPRNITTSSVTSPPRETCTLLPSMPSRWTVNQNGIHTPTTPWPLIAQVLNKVLTERVSIMMVVPHWHKAPWYSIWQYLFVLYVLFIKPCVSGRQWTALPEAPLERAHGHSGLQSPLRRCHVCTSRESNLWTSRSN